MIRYKDIYSDYEQLLIGNRTEFPSYHLKGTYAQNQLVIASLYRYLFEKILHWSKTDVKLLLTVEVEKDFLLYELANRYIKFPSNITETERSLFIGNMCYPGTIKYDIESTTIAEYERIMADAQRKWSNNFFSNDRTGCDRAEICLRYCINKYFAFTSLDDIYIEFSNPAKALETLKRYRLKKACEKLYLSPLEFLHSSLSSLEIDADNFMYAFILFKRNYAEIVKEEGNKQNEHK